MTDIDTNPWFQGPARERQMSRSGEKSAAPAEAAEMALEQQRVLEMLSRGEDLDDILTVLIRLFEHMMPEVRDEISLLLRFHQAAVKNAGEAIFWIDNAGRFFYFNDAACHALGYSRTELAELKVSDVNLDIPAEAWAGRWQQMVERGRLTFETRHRRKDGTLFPVEAGAVYLRVDQGEYACVVARDISARKKALEERRLSERRYQTLTEVSPVGIFRTDPLGRCLFVNQRWCEITGLSADEASGEGWSQALHPEDAERVYAEWQSFAQGEQPFELEYRFRHRDGSVRWVIGQAVSEQGVHGEVVGYVGTVTDITDRKEADRRLSSIVEGTSPTTGEAFFRSLVEHLALAFEVRYALVGELRDDRVHTLAVWNENRVVENMSYELMGTPCENVLTGRVACFFPNQVREEFPRDVLLIEMGVESYLGLPLVNSAGQSLGILAVLSEYPMPQDPQGERLLAVFAARATAELERLRLEEERRNLEAQVQHAQKLESLGVLAGGIAHDFNNFLGGILGNAEFALTRMESSSDVRPLLEEIARAAERCAELSNQMLAYSGKGKFVVERFELGQMVREMVDLLRMSISKKAHLHFDFAQDLPPIEGDPTQIRQVVMNLITNASDSLGEDSGDIYLRTGRVNVGVESFGHFLGSEWLRPGDHVFLEVRDTGCGMDEETRSRLFDPFFTTKFTGRGLGMAAVLGIVRAHHGAIRLDSSPGQGSTFQLLFAAEGASQGPLPEESTRSREPWRGSGTILVVDDEEIVRVLARSILEDAGFEILECDNGRVALDTFKQHYPAHAPEGGRNRKEIVAVLLDMTMPELDGAETFRELRQLCPDVRVILSSGYSEQVALRRFGETGVAGFIQKPYRPAHLLEKVQEVLGTL